MPSDFKALLWLLKLGALVNKRRFVIPRAENPHPKPRALAFGAFADVCAAWAETVAVVPSADVARARWDAASPCVHYNPATAAGRMRMCTPPHRSSRHFG